MVIVQVPLSQILDEVGSDSIQVNIVPDNLFEVVSLPQPVMKTRPIQLLYTTHVVSGRNTLEPASAVVERRSSARVL